MKMPATKVLKQTPVEAPRDPQQRPDRLKARTVPAGGPTARKSRASSCPRCPQRGRCEGRSGAQDTAFTKTRSSSTAPRTTSKWPRTNPDHRRATSAVKHAAVEPKCRNMRSSCPGQREPQGVRAETRPSHKAFTVIPPNPKKRREIQRKAEAELAALEELRLSRAMAYVSINPSSVGGCMSLEEVRLKQQQEMMQAKRKQKPMKTQVIEQTAVLKC